MDERSSVTPAVSVVYILMFYALLRRAHKVETVWALGSWLFAFWIGVCRVPAYRSTPPVVREGRIVLDI